MLFRNLFIALCASLFGGCVSHHGNFTKLSPDFNQKIAADTVAQLTAIYPPAKTHFYFKQTIRDSYGVSLVALLRKKGYGVTEMAPGRTHLRLFSGRSSFNEGLGLELTYLVDGLITPNLYRVTVATGGQFISCAYVLKNGTAYPRGTWVRKE